LIKQRAGYIRIEGLTITMFSIGLTVRRCIQLLARLSVVLAAALAQAALAQTEPPQSDLSTLARREGVVSVYSAAPADDNTALVAAFEKKFGLKVMLWRAGSEEVRTRVLNEARAGRAAADVIFNNLPALEALRREALLEPMALPSLAGIMPMALPSHRSWADVFLTAIVSASNTNAIRSNQHPNTYRDLLSANLQGPIGIEAGDFDWFAGICQQVGESECVRLFRDIGARNGYSARRGHALLANTVASGELSMALTVYAHTAEQLKGKGAPINWRVVEPLIGQPAAVAIMRHAMHPAAGKIFCDFVLGEGQAILRDRGLVVTSRVSASPIDRNLIKVLDPAEVLDHSDRWQKLFADVFLAPRTAR
jgi:iron(III) transport system substrate-binding protein